MVHLSEVLLSFYLAHPLRKPQAWAKPQCYCTSSGFCIGIPLGHLGRTCLTAGLRCLPPNICSPQPFLWDPGLTQLSNCLPHFHRKLSGSHDLYYHYCPLLGTQAKGAATLQNIFSHKKERKKCMT